MVSGYIWQVRRTFSHDLTYQNYYNRLVFDELFKNKKVDVFGTQCKSISIYPCCYPTFNSNSPKLPFPTDFMDCPYIRNYPKCQSSNNIYFCLSPKWHKDMYWFTSIYNYSKKYQCITLKSPTTQVENNKLTWPNISNTIVTTTKALLHWKGHLLWCHRIKYHADTMVSIAAGLLLLTISNHRGVWISNKNFNPWFEITTKDQQIVPLSKDSPTFAKFHDRNIISRLRYL